MRFDGEAHGCLVRSPLPHARIRRIDSSRATSAPGVLTSESLQPDTQDRGHITDAAIALDKDGRFLALSVRSTVDLGAYLSQLAPLTATGVGAPVQAGAYRFRAVEINVRAMFANNVPIDAFRGAGRPEATYVLERLIDPSGSLTGLRSGRAAGPQSARHPDLVPDRGHRAGHRRQPVSGQPDSVSGVADRAGFESRRRESAARGRLRECGFANYLEANGGLQVAEAMRTGAFPVECAALTFSGDGCLDIADGTQSSRTMLFRFSSWLPSGSVSIRGTSPCARHHRRWHRGPYRRNGDPYPGRYRCPCPASNSNTGAAGFPNRRSAGAQSRHHRRVTGIQRSSRRLPGWLRRNGRHGEHRPAAHSGRRILHQRFQHRVGRVGSHCLTGLSENPPTISGGVRAAARSSRAPCAGRGDGGRDESTWHGH